MAAWLRAELELLGVLCVVADRHWCGDAPAHAVARAAVDAALVGERHGERGAARPCSSSPPRSSFKPSRSAIHGAEEGRGPPAEGGRGRAPRPAAGGKGRAARLTSGGR